MLEVELFLQLAAVAAGLLTLLKFQAVIRRGMGRAVSGVLGRVLGTKAALDKLETLAQGLQLMNSRVDDIVAEMKPNHGGSLRDVVNRIERRQIHIDERSKAILHESQNAIFETDIDGRCVWVNRRYLRISGRALDEIVGLGWLNTVHVDDRVRVGGEWQRAVNDRRELHVEYRMLNAEGYCIYVRCVAHKLVDPLGQLLGYVGILTPLGKHECPYHNDPKGCSERCLLSRNVDDEENDPA